MPAPAPASAGYVVGPGDRVGYIVAIDRGGPFPAGHAWVDGGGLDGGHPCYGWRDRTPWPARPFWTWCLMQDGPGTHKIKCPPGSPPHGWECRTGGYRDGLCRQFDLDGDCKVTLRDFAVFQNMADPHLVFTR